MALLVVVGFMAGDAGGFEFFLVQEAGVTGIALRQIMFPAQGVFGVVIVVEGGDAPILFGMARLALLAKAALVALLVVVGLVAGHAEGLQLFLE